MNYSMLFLATKKAYANLLFKERRKMVGRLVMAQTTTLTLKMLMQKIVSILTIMHVVQMQV